MFSQWPLVLDSAAVVSAGGGWVAVGAVAVGAVAVVVAPELVGAAKQQLSASHEHVAACAPERDACASGMS